MLFHCSVYVSELLELNVWVSLSQCPIKTDYITRFGLCKVLMRGGFDINNAGNLQKNNYSLNGNISYFYTQWSRPVQHSLDPPLQSLARSKKKARSVLPQPTSFMADTLTTQLPWWIMEKAMGFVVKALCILTETQPPCLPEPRQLGRSLWVNADGRDAQQWKMGNKLA